MFRSIIFVLGLLIAAPAAAQIEPFPPGFVERDVATNGTTLHVR